MARQGLDVALVAIPGDTAFVRTRENVQRVSLVAVDDENRRLVAEDVAEITRHIEGERSKVRRRLALEMSARRLECGGRRRLILVSFDRVE